MSSDSVVEEVINSAVADDAPSMGLPLRSKIKLLRGLYVAETGEWHDTAVVRELNGSDEEYMATLGSEDKLSFTEFMTGFLDRALVSVGSLRNPGLSNKLILPDRNVVFLAITRATYGAEKEVVVSCNKCGTEQAVIIELDNDFPVLGYDRNLREPISVTLSKGEVKMRIPNGEDTIYATNNSDDNPALLNTLIYARCVVSTASFQDSVEWAKDLPVPDRRKLDSAISEATEGLGPQLKVVETRCDSCANQMRLGMDWVSLLLY